MLKYHIFFIYYLLFTGLLPGISKGQGNSSHTFADTLALFKSDDLLYIYIQANFDTILNNRHDSAHYEKGLLWYYDKNCVKQTTNVKIKTRGNFRLNPNHCTFPPIRLKFKPQDVKGSIFEGQKKIKVVTHCQADEYVLREFLIYKIYNALSDASYRVRLAQIHYINTASQNDTLINYAFLLENTKLMAQRNHGKIVKPFQVSKDSLDKNYTTLLYLFQFMIGNSDWDIDLQKNIKFLQLNWYDKLIPIPYDFDWSETVNAPYTRVEAYEGNTPVTRRKLKNIERSNSDFKIALKYIEEKEKEIYHVINDFQYLSYDQKQEFIKFIDTFYKILKKSHYNKDKFYLLIKKLNEKENKQKLHEAKKNK